MPIPPVLALSTFGVVLLLVLAVLVLLVVGGIVASGRAARARETRLLAAIARADQELAAARAGDNGWEPAQMERAVRAAWDAGHHHGEAIAQLQLIQVVDRPGTDADEAVYRVVGAGGHEHDLMLKRVGGAWTS